MWNGFYIDRSTLAVFPQRGSSAVDNVHLLFLFPCLALSRGSRAIVQSKLSPAFISCCFRQTKKLEVCVRQEGPIRSFSPTGPSSSTKTLLPCVVLSYVQQVLSKRCYNNTTAALLSLTPLQNPCVLARSPSGHLAFTGDVVNGPDRTVLRPRVNIR